MRLTRAAFLVAFLAAASTLTACMYGPTTYLTNGATGRTAVCGPYPHADAVAEMEKECLAKAAAQGFVPIKN
jgi:hypothetical protein